MTRPLVVDPRRKDRVVRQQRWWTIMFLLLPCYAFLRLQLGITELNVAGLLINSSDFEIPNNHNTPRKSRYLSASEQPEQQQQQQQQQHEGEEHLPKHSDRFATDNEFMKINPKESSDVIVPSLKAEAAKTGFTSSATISQEQRDNFRRRTMDNGTRKRRRKRRQLDNEDTVLATLTPILSDKNDSTRRNDNDDDHHLHHREAADDDEADDDDGVSQVEEEETSQEYKQRKNKMQWRKEQIRKQKEAHRIKLAKEAKVAAPDGFEDFSYVPVGKYASRDLVKRAVIATATTTGNNSTLVANNSPYAYAFVMGGVNEQDDNYLGMLYNVLIAAYILDKEGSSADIVMYVQMSCNSELTELPAEDQRLLEAVKVKVRYLPKPQVENFHQIIMQKMVVLDLVEYKRVLFLDTDVMPFCNLDYVFELSDGPKPILKQNLIIALSGSPANAGFWMVSPKPGELQKLQKIVAKQQEKAKKLPYPHFNEREGWGHVIRPPDKWWTINHRYERRVWKFVGSHADQGLLYHWVKYVKRSVSIVSGVEVDNYGPKNTRDRIQLEKTLKNPFDQFTCLPEKYENTFGESLTPDAQGMAPYRDFVHFLGGKKPWKKHASAPVTTNTESATPDQYWFFMLRLLNKEFNMGIDFDNWERIKSPLGSLPKKDLMVELMQANQTLLQS